MYFATFVEPTKLIAATSGCLSNASTVSAPPWTMLKTPSGNPASVSNSASRTGVSGTFGEGLRMNALPQTMAMGNIQSGTIAGKLNGVIPAQSALIARLGPPLGRVPDLFAAGSFKGGCVTISDKENFFPADVIVTDCVHKLPSLSSSSPAEVGGSWRPALSN